MSEDVIARLNVLVARGDDVLRTNKPNPPNVIGFPTLETGSFTGWRSQSLSFLRQILGQTHTYVVDFEKEVADGFPSRVKQGQAILKAVAEDIAAGIIPTQSSSASQGSSDTFDLLDRVASRFHVIACQLRSRHADRPTLDLGDEYDVQDLLHALLHLFFDDIRPAFFTCGRTSAPLPPAMNAADRQ